MAECGLGTPLRTLLICSSGAWGVTRNLIVNYLHTFYWTAANTILCVYTDIFLRTVYVVNMTLYAIWFQIVLKQERRVAGASWRGHAERRSHAEQEFHRQFRSRERRSRSRARDEISRRRLYVGHLALSSHATSPLYSSPLLSLKQMQRDEYEWWGCSGNQREGSPP